MRGEGDEFIRSRISSRGCVRPSLLLKTRFYALTESDPIPPRIGRDMTIGIISIYAEFIQSLMEEDLESHQWQVNTLPSPC